LPRSLHLSELYAAVTSTASSRVTPSPRSARGRVDVGSRRLFGKDPFSVPTPLSGNPNRIELSTTEQREGEVDGGWDLSPGVEQLEVPGDR
jgi:hypothetical protein